MANRLEQTLENAWGALQVGDPAASEIDFRAALLMATATVLANHLPVSTDHERQAESFRRILYERLQGVRARSRQLAFTEQRLAAYDGPEIA